MQIKCPKCGEDITGAVFSKIGKSTKKNKEFYSRIGKLGTLKRWAKKKKEGTEAVSA